LSAASVVLPPSTMLSVRVAESVARTADRVLALLAEDATWSMPPTPTWYRGREAVTSSLVRHPLAERWRHLPARANGQLAVSSYIWNDEAGAYLAAVLDLLTVDADGRIVEVTGFLAPWLFGRFGEADGGMTPEEFARFGLPAQLPE
jgi:hypothetical protein